MKMKKILVSSLATIALAGSLASGATYALFTANDEVNIAISAGKVKVSASIENFAMYSGYNADDHTAAKEFANGGKASLNANELVLDRITPMDGVTFDIKIVNESNVNIQYRTIIFCSEGPLLFSGLDISVDGVLFDSGLIVSPWTPLGKDDGPLDLIPIEIKLPEGAGNVYQEASTKIKFVVEAIQGNANIDNTVTTSDFYPVYKPGSANIEDLYASDGSLAVSLVTDVQVGSFATKLFAVANASEIAALKKVVNIAGVNVDISLNNIGYYNSVEALDSYLYQVKPDTNTTELVFIDEVDSNGKKIAYNLTSQNHSSAKLALIGIGDVTLYAGVVTSNQTGFFFDNDTSLINLNFEVPATDTFKNAACVKITGNINATVFNNGCVENAFIYNCKMTNGKGLNIAVVRNTVIDGLEVLNSQSNSITVSCGSNVTISRFTSINPNWGCFLGIIYAASPVLYAEKSIVTFLSGSTFPDGQNAYIDNFADHNSEIFGLEAYGFSKAPQAGKPTTYLYSR